MLLKKIFLFIISAILVLPQLNFATNSNHNKVYRIAVTGSINPGSAAHIIESIELAEKEKAWGVIIVLDTPGGLLSATRDIVKKMLNTEVRTVVHVAPKGSRAGSAGVFITMAADLAVMAPATNIGAAHPVSITGSNAGEGDKNQASDMRKKIENDTVAFIQGISTHRNRNTEWAKDAVIDSVSVTAKEALDLNVIDFVSEDLEGLLKEIDGTPIKSSPNQDSWQTAELIIVKKDMSDRNRFLNAFSDPNITYILIILGLAGLAMEFYNPGLIFPGLIGAVSMIFAVISIQMIPINTGALLLLGAGFALLILEAFIPSFGVLTLVGLTCLVSGGILLTDTDSEEIIFHGNYQVEPLTIIGTLLAILIILGPIAYLVFKTYTKGNASGKDVLIGRTAKVFFDHSGKAKAKIDGEIWNLADTDNLSDGDEIEINGIDGLKLITTKKEI